MQEYNHPVRFRVATETADLPAGGVFVKWKASKLWWAGFTHSSDLWFLQGQPVCLSHVCVSLQHKHGDYALCSHDDHVRISHRAMHYGSAQVHRDEVELCYWGQKNKGHQCQWRHSHAQNFQTFFYLVSKKKNKKIFFTLLIKINSTQALPCN